MTDLTLSSLLTSFVDAHGPAAFREPSVASNLLSDALGDIPDLDPGRRQVLVASVKDRTLARLLDRSPRAVDGWSAERTPGKPEWLYEAWAAPCDRDVFPIEALGDTPFAVFALDVCRRLSLQPVRPMPTQRPIEAMLALAGDGAVLRVAGIKTSPAGSGGSLTPKPNTSPSSSPPYSMLVSQAASGETLGDRIASLGPASATTGSAVMRSLAAAVADLHRQGVVHGLLGPENVIFDTWQTVIVTDVGLATQAGRGPTVDSDIQSLAALAFYVFSGAAPPAGSHRNSVARLADVAPHAPAPLADVVDRALTPDPQQVKPTAMDFYRALDPALVAPLPPPATAVVSSSTSKAAAVSSTPEDVTTTTPQPSPDSGRRRISREVAIGVVLGLVAAGLVIAFALKPGGDERATTATAAVSTTSVAVTAAAVVTAAPDVSNSAPPGPPSSATPGPPSTAAPPATTTAAAVEPLTSVDGMVPIEAGTYIVGAETGGLKIKESSKARPVTLNPYFIDATEVSNEEYLRWLQTVADKVPTPTDWGDDETLDVGTEKRPVQGVAFEFADAYCRALGKRLPEEAEWEVAAKATQKFQSPTDDDTTYDVGTITTNISDLGVYDMVGNVWEYTTNSYEDAIRSDTSLLIVRGGTNNFNLDPTKRATGAPTEFYMAKWAGFRCAVSAQAPPPASEFTSVEISEPPAAPEHKVLPSDEYDYDFKDPTFDTWPGKKTANTVSGYHPLESFHLEVKGDALDLVSAAPTVNLDYDNFNYTITAEGGIFADKTDSADGHCFGIGAGIDSTDQGIFLTVCPTISPGNATANILMRKSDGSVFAPYANQSVSIRRDSLVTLQIEVLGPDSFQFLVNGRSLGPTVDGQLEAFLGLAGGRGVGLYVKKAAGPDTKVHVHFHHFTLSKTPKA